MTTAKRYLSWRYPWRDPSDDIDNEIPMLVRGGGSDDNDTIAAHLAGIVSSLA